MISAGKKALLASTLANRSVTPIGIDFDGTNDYGSLGVDLTGNADGKTFTFSCWVYSTGGTPFLFDIADPVGGASNPARIYIRQNGTNLLVQIATEPYETIVLSVTAIAALPLNTWNHVLVSCNMADTADRAVYINGELTSPTWSTYSNIIIPFTGGAGGVRFSIGATTDGQVPLDGRLAGVYLDYTYRDLSDSANRRLFIDAEGRYATPPTSGIISMPMDDPTNPYRNDGTGQDFTANGTVARSGRGPNQYNPAASTYDGSADYLALTSALWASGQSQFTFSVKFKKDASGNTRLFSAQDASSNTPIICTVSSSGLFSVSFNTPSGSIFGNITSAGAVQKWRQIDFSIDIAAGTGHMYADGEAVSFPAINTGYLIYACSVMQLARQVTTSVYYGGEISDFWFDTSYIDLSADNPFYDTDTGKAKYLGADGSTPTGSQPLIYLPMRGDDAGNNLGSGGDFTVNSGPYTGARGPNEFWANSMETNGTNQELTRTSALTGAVATKFMTLAFAINPDSADPGYIFSTTSSTIEIRGASGAYDLSMRNSAGAPVFVENSWGSLTTGQWSTVLVCVDTSDSANCLAYVDGASVTFTPTTLVDDTIDYATSNTKYFGSNQGVDPYFADKMGFFYMSSEYIDFSQEANRLKFFDAFNYPVDLGADGSTPTGTAPLIYMNEGFHLGTNLGTGGNFTPTNAPTDGGFVRG
jgi:hypothetical protein